MPRGVPGRPALTGPLAGELAGPPPGGPLGGERRTLLGAEFGDVPVLPTAAGHDAGVLSTAVPTAMLFVRNPTGVSHSPEEYAEIADCHQGARALAAVMKDWVA